MALSNTSWFLKHRPFFSFLNTFSTSDQNPVAQSFRLAHELHDLNNSNVPTKFNNIQSDIKYLIQYKNNWFGNLFFPKELSDALNNFDKDQDFLSLCKALANNTNTWFFPTLNLFGQTPLMQAYRKFEARLGKSVAQSDKSYVLKEIASSDAPLEQLEIITCYYSSVYLLKGKRGNVIDQNAMKMCLQWLEKYPKLKIEDLLRLRKNASDTTIRALMKLGDDNTDGAAEGLAILPAALLNDPSCIDAIIHHAQPNDAARILGVFHTNMLLDTETDKTLCLEFLTQNQPIQSRFDRHDVFNRLQCIFCNLEKDKRFRLQEKRSIVKHSKHLLDPLTDTLWHAVPDDLFYKSYQDLITICETNASDGLLSKIIQYFLAIPAVFNNAWVQVWPQYDRYTESQIDQLLPNKDPEFCYNALPHLIRRNTEEANKIILDLLSDPAIGKKASQLNSGKRNAINNDQLTSEQILSCARTYNDTVFNAIQEMRLSSTWANNSETLFSGVGIHPIQKLGGPAP